MIDDSAAHTYLLKLLFYFYFIVTIRHKGLRFNYQTSVIYFGIGVITKRRILLFCEIENYIRGST